MPGITGTPPFLHDAAGHHLVAQVADHPCRRTDEHDALRLAAFGENGVFRQEAVAGMDRFGPGVTGGGDDAVDVQVAGGRFGRADGNGFVGLQGVQGPFVHLRVDRHGGNPHLAAGAHDAQGDLPAIGNENLFEHHHVSVSG